MLKRVNVFLLLGVGIIYDMKVIRI